MLQKKRTRLAHLANSSAPTDSASTTDWFATKYPTARMIQMSLCIATSMSAPESSSTNVDTNVWILLLASTASATKDISTFTPYTLRRALKTNKQLSEARNKQATYISETRDGSSFVASHFFIVCPIHVMKGFTHRQRFNLQLRFIKTRMLKS